MAMIHVNRAGTSLGVFAEEDVREGLRTGRLTGTDLGWREGMAQWQPLSQFAEFAGDLPAGATPPPPAATVATSASTASAPRSGLPWDQRQQRGLFTAFVETLQMVLSRPSEAFTAMKVEGGFGEPIIYALIGGCVGTVVSFVLSLGLQSIGVFSGQRDALGMFTMFGIGSVFLILLVPFFIIIALFIGSLITHVCLAIVGGVNRPFETTFRVIAFSQGSVGPIQMIPVCGGFIALIWGLVVECIGLARAHETDMWRAVVAILLPFILCCGCFGALFAFGILGHWNAAHQP
jgi:hypothetical protein